MLEVESQDSQKSQRNATGFMFLYFSDTFVAVLGGQNLMFSRLILVGRAGDILGYSSPMTLKEDRTSSPRSCPANFVHDSCRDVHCPPTLSGFLSFIRTSTSRKLQVGLPGCQFLEVLSLFSFAKSVKHFRRDGINSVV